MTHSIKAIAIGAFAVALLLMLPVGSSIAQSAGADSGSSGGASLSNQQPIDDATLQHTAKAFVKVTQIAQTQKQMMTGQGDDNAKMNAAKQAESEKVAAVKSEGLQPQQYNQVLQVVQNDTNLQHKFLSYVKESGGVPSDNSNM